MVEVKKLDKSLEHAVIANLSIALNYVENAYDNLNYYVKNEKDLTEIEREKLYTYGILLAQLNVVKLATVKKSLLKITDNKRIKT